jgi:hypothetical protein
MPQNMKEKKDMNYKELFGSELAGKIEEIIKEKGVTLILDDSKNPSYIPKSRFDEVIGQKNGLKEQVTELTSQLAGLKKSAAGNEELTKKLQDLEKNNSEWESKFKKAQIESAVKIKAMSEKAKDPTDLLKFIDISSVEFGKDGELKGIEELITGLKEKKSYLFDSQEKPAPPKKDGINPAGGQEILKSGKIAQLETALQSAIESRNTQLQISLQNELWKLNNEK